MIPFRQSVYALQGDSRETNLLFLQNRTSGSRPLVLVAEGTRWRFDCLSNPGTQDLGWSPTLVLSSENGEVRRPTRRTLSAR